MSGSPSAPRSYTVTMRLDAPDGVIYGPAGAASLVGQPFSVRFVLDDLAAEVTGTVVSAVLVREGRAIDLTAEVGEDAPQPEPRLLVRQAPNPLAYFLGRGPS